MSRQDRGRQPTFRFRLPSWASPASLAPQRGPSQRQPSRVTTTATEPPPSAAQEQPSSTPQPRRQTPVSPSRPSAPPRRSSQPPSASPGKPQMGTAPSRPASGTRPPRTQADSTPTPPPSPDAAPPRPQPIERVSQPAPRTPSRQLSRTFTQPPSPSRPPSQIQTATPRAPSPSPPPPLPSPEPPAASPPLPAAPDLEPTASTAKPKAPSTTPFQALPTPAAGSRPPSPSLGQTEPVVQQIPEAPSLSSTSTTAPASPTTKVLQLQPLPSLEKKGIDEEETTEAPTHLQPPPTQQKKGIDEEATTEAPTQFQLQETSQEKDQTPTDSTYMPIEVKSRLVPVAGGKPMSTESPIIPPPEPSNISSQHIESDTKPDKTQDHLPSTKEREPEEIEEVEPVIKPVGGQESGFRPSQNVERKPEETEEKEKPVHQPKRDDEGDPTRPKSVGTKPEEFKKETPKTSPEPIPGEKPRITDNRETTDMVEIKQTSQEPDQKPPTQVPQEAMQPIKEVKVLEAEQQQRQTPPPDREPAPPNSHRGREGKIAISTIAKTSTSSKEQSGSLQKEIRDGISRLVQSLAVQHSKQPGGGQGISIITLAGENQGASMYVGYGTTTGSEGKVLIHKGPVLNGSDVAAVGDDGQTKKADDKLSTMAATSTSVNSNVQAINNSILQDSCSSEENPGVHLVVSNKPPEPAQLGSPKATETQKHRTRPPLLPLKMMSSEPSVRRRCLRALFLEPSDDDVENPQKPRRHGCRFSCDEAKKPKGDQDGTLKDDAEERNAPEGVDRA